MYKHTSTQSRPSTTVEFFNFQSTAVPDTYREYFRNTYILTGQLINHEVTMSEDNLTMTITNIWISEAELNTYLTDNEVLTNFINPSKAYMEANGIIRTVVSGEEL